jgi:hypothetical protein
MLTAKGKEVFSKNKKEVTIEACRNVRGFSGGKLGIGLPATRWAYRLLVFYLTEKIGGVGDGMVEKFI